MPVKPNGTPKMQHNRKNKKPLKSFDFNGFLSAPRGIRTHDLLIRSQTLYPAELGALARTRYMLSRKRNFVNRFFEIFLKKVIGGGKYEKGASAP